MRKLIALLQAAMTDFSRNNCPYVAAGIAYWMLFSLFPLALAGISILGFVYSTAEEQRRLVEGLVRLVPVSTEYLAGVVNEVAHARGPLGILAVAGLLWSGTAVFSALRKGINHAWHVGQPPYFLWERAMDLAMLLGVALLALIVVVFTTNVLGLGTLSAAPAWLVGGWVGKALVELAALGVTVGVLVLLYRYLPNTRVEWRDVRVGAVVGAVLFQGVRTGFTWFVSSFGSFNLVYGSLGALMAVLVWAYLSAMTIVWGAQVCFTYSRLMGSHVGEELVPGFKPPPPSQKARRGFLGLILTVASWLLPPRRSRR